MAMLIIGRRRWIPVFLANVLLASAAQLAPNTGPSKTESVSPADPVLPSELDLHLLTQRAALIFSGTVMAIDMNDGTEPPLNGPDKGVEVKFQVDEGIKGVATGEQLTLHEWRGLWGRGRGQRYRVGERMLIFYHQPSPLGFSSPVSGDAGRFTIQAGDRIPLTSQQERALLRAPRLHSALTDRQISRGLVHYEQVARIVRRMVAEK
jgi:hypothetical protein